MDEAVQSRVKPALRTLAAGADPRRSLVASLIWLVVALAASFSAAASLWVGRVARDIVVQQHIRRLLLETDRLASDFGESVRARVDAAGAQASGLPINAAFQYLEQHFPDQQWIAAADAHGTVVASNGGLRVGLDAHSSPWFSESRAAPWIGLVNWSGAAPEPAISGYVAVPVRNAAGELTGSVLSRLPWPRPAGATEGKAGSLLALAPAQTMVVDADDVVHVGPAALVGRRWTGHAIDDTPAIVRGLAPAGSLETLRFERVGDATVLVARVPIDFAGPPAGRWRVQIVEPRSDVYQRADSLVQRIVWISACLGTLTALVGAVLARRLTGGLRELTRSAAAVGQNETARIEVPAGRDEVAQLAAVLSKVLDDLRQERSGLLALSTDLERRVAVRTREVERLAEEARYAAVVRERLKIARDLHDTLAHSMMAMLSEVRLLRRLQMHDPAALPDELARAEEVARLGLNEARTAISQMRVDAVRDTGLAAALATAFERFLERTGLSGSLQVDPGAAAFADERAETLFRMAAEVLRNVERHAAASRIDVFLSLVDGALISLRLVDDGSGFDIAAPRTGHFGLVGLREQAQLIGAELSIVSAPGRGTSVTITLPLAPEI